MKRLFLILFGVIVLSLLCNAQGLNIKVGSLLSVQNDKEVRAKNVNVGELIEFRTYEDFKVGDSIALPKGTKVYAKVLEAKKSGIAGTKGKLKIEWVYCLASSGVKIPLEGEIDFAKKSHTSGAVVAAAVVAAPLIFLTGQQLQFLQVTKT